jgi:hypothetical protein
MGASAFSSPFPAMTRQISLQLKKKCLLVDGVNSLARFLL